MATDGDVCGSCSKTFFGRQQFLHCSGICGRRFHCRCINVAPEYHDLLMKDGSSTYRCSSCTKQMGDKDNAQSATPSHLDPSLKVDNESLRVQLAQNNALLRKSLPYVPEAASGSSSKTFSSVVQLPNARQPEAEATTSVHLLPRRRPTVDDEGYRPIRLKERVKALEGSRPESRLSVVPRPPRKACSFRLKTVPMGFSECVCVWGGGKACVLPPLKRAPLDRANTGAQGIPRGGARNHPIRRADCRNDLGGRGFSLHQKALKTLASDRRIA
ncbi:hypothetical protein HPB47_004561 [Ixodes persulcatus]|uniref:Uncharacterized protein n=1 Tax=Ixodes persulcatus TaxID=34615 RepID=A0AC60PFG2_IXOPE|nr:hypothetical protein HPB47_004561 [Ixodes persulcatus]